MRSLFLLGCLILGVVGCRDPLADLNDSSRPAAPSPAAPSQTAVTPVSPQTVMDEIKSFQGKQPVLVVLTSNQDALNQQLTAAEAELQAKNVVVYEVFDIDRAYAQGQRRGGAALSQQDASNLVDSYGMGPSGTIWTLIDKEGKTAYRGKENLTVTEILAKLPGE